MTSEYTVESYLDEIKIAWMLAGHKCHYNEFDEYGVKMCRIRFETENKACCDVYMSYSKLHSLYEFEKFKRCRVFNPDKKSIPIEEVRQEVLSIM